MDPVTLGLCSQMDLDMEVARANKTADTVTQVVYKIAENQKHALIAHLLRQRFERHNRQVHALGVGRKKQVDAEIGVEPIGTQPKC